MIYARIKIINNQKLEKNLEFPNRNQIDKNSHINNIKLRTMSTRLKLKQNICWNLINFLNSKFLSWTKNNFAKFCKFLQIFAKFWKICKILKNFPKFWKVNFIHELFMNFKKQFYKILQNFAKIFAKFCKIL